MTMDVTAAAAQKERCMEPMIKREQATMDGARATGH
jgi:hypothetical protein